MLLTREVEQQRLANPPVARFDPPAGPVMSRMMCCRRTRPSETSVKLQRSRSQRSPSSARCWREQVEEHVRDRQTALAQRLDKGAGRTAVMRHDQLREVLDVGCRHRDGAAPAAALLGAPRVATSRRGTTSRWMARATVASTSFGSVFRSATHGSVSDREPGLWPAPDDRPDDRSSNLISVMGLSPILNRFGQEGRPVPFFGQAMRDHHTLELCQLGVVHLNHEPISDVAQASPPRRLGHTNCEIDLT